MSNLGMFGRLPTASSGNTLATRSSNSNDKTPKVVIKEQHRGSTLKLLFFVISESVDSPAFITETMHVADLADIRFKLSRDAQTLSCGVSVKKSETAKQSKVKIQVNYDRMNEELTCTENWSEFIELPKTVPIFDIANGTIFAYTMEVNVAVEDVTDRLEAYVHLYEDRICVDLQLCAPEGLPVDMHKVVIVQHSELFRELLTNPDRKNEKQFPIQGVTAETLQQLREYMYRGTLPVAVEGLPQLLLLAIHGKMKQLKNDCIRKIVTIATGAKLDEIIKFAIKFNIPELIHAMLSMTSDRVVHDSHMKMRHDMKFPTSNFTLLSLTN